MLINDELEFIELHPVILGFGSSVELRLFCGFLYDETELSDYINDDSSVGVKSRILELNK